MRLGGLEDQVLGSTQLDQVRDQLARLGRPYEPADVSRALAGLGIVVTDAAVLTTMETLRRSSVGAGPLEELLHLDGVTDVLVNGPEQVFIDRGRGLERTRVRFGSEAEVRALAVRLANASGRRLDDASPWVDAHMSDGTRVHAVLGMLSDPGTCISLRVPSRKRLSLDQWHRQGCIDDLGHQVLQAMVHNRTAFLVCGGTGSGKTTLLASLLGQVGPSERIVVVEDSRELNPDHPHVVRLEARVANAEGAGAITLTTLVRQALRMRPDRLVLGEVRGAELTDLLMAMNTGHEGGCGTIHANSVADVVARVEALAALGGLDRMACQAQLLSALDAVIHIERGRDGVRRVRQIGLLAGDVGSAVVQPALLWGADGQMQRGPASEALFDRIGWQ